MMNFLKIGAISGILSVAATGAFALSFDLGAPNGNIGSPAFFSFGGVDLTVTPSGGGIHQQDAGLGVTTGSNDLDAGEFLDFQFSETILISSVTFGSFGGDTYELFTDTGTTTVAFTGAGTASFDPDLETDFIRVSATSGAFRVQSFSFDPIAASVPLPAGLPLLAGALGLLGLARRRKG